MNSITKTKLNEDEILRIVKHGFGKDSIITSLEEFNGGFFNSAYGIGLNDGKECVLKVAPSPETKVLRFEEGIMETEVHALKLLAACGIPVPKVYYYDNSRQILNNDYLFMEKIEGVPLLQRREKLTEEQKRHVDAEVGKYTRKINGIKGDLFGHFYKLEKKSRSWTTAFDILITDILQDGIELKVKLPLGYNEIYDIMKSYYHTLDPIKEPCLVHYDLWDGNIFINDRNEISGIIDCERAFWGDPLIEFNFSSLAYNQAFLQGYGSDILTTVEERCRRLLYDVYYFLVSAIEVTNRQYENKDQEKWACSQLEEFIAKLQLVK